MKYIYNSTDSTILIISSPFQALCAISAIRNLCLEEYTVLALLPVKEIRNEQVVSLLKYYQVAFHVQYITRKEEIRLRILAFLRPPGKFSRVFIGNYNDLNLKLTAFKYLKRGGTIIHLDDGIATISLLQNKLFSIGFLQKEYLNFLGYSRNVDYYSNLYTIYSDIPNKKYKIQGNQLRCLSEKNTKEKGGVYFIGTNTSVYCGRQKVPIKSFENYLESLFIEILAKYPHESIYYVPHGRDNSDFVRALCDKHQVIFLRPKTCVEVMLLQAKLIPTAIIGFTSTALFNIKNIFPSTSVINILINSQQEGSDYLRLKEVSNYYSRHEIQLIEKCLT